MLKQAVRKYTLKACGTHTPCKFQTSAISSGQTITQGLEEKKKKKGERDLIHKGTKKNDQEDSKDQI